MKVALPRSAQRTAIIYTDIYHAQKKYRIRTLYTVLGTKDVLNCDHSVSKRSLVATSHAH